MNITKILDETVPMEVEWNGEKIAFDVRKANLTPNMLRSVNSVADYSKAVAESVTKWDVTTDDEGTMWPLTDSELSRLPVPFLSAILDKISETWAGDKKKPEASANTSVAAAN
jgi:hypothetical protein